MNNSIKFNNNLDTDFKFEVMVDSLIKQGYSPESIRILREGIARRAVSKDIEEVYKQYNENDFTENIHVNREGIYDILPEGLFHQPLRKTLSHWKTLWTMN